MKNLLACLAILVAFNVTAQVDGFQLPYNPDAQPDGFIGAADVIELLTFYGQSFTPDGIYVNDDSTHMVLDVGDHNFWNCIEQCSSLPGSWRVLTDADLGVVYEDFPPNKFVWRMLPDFNQNFGLSNSNNQSVFDSPSQGTNIQYYSYDRNNVLGCFCATQERPKVEYSYCHSTLQDAFATCCDAKVVDGWYPLCSNPSSRAGSSAVTAYSQAFWRWAD